MNSGLKNKLLCFVLLLGSFAFPARSNAALYERTKILMGNIPVTISINSSSVNRHKIFTAMDSTFEKAKELEQVLSHFNPQSDISKLNQAQAKQWVTISKTTLELLQKSHDLSQYTEGYFDISFASKNKSASYQDLEIESQNYRARLLKKNIILNVSGIAKGMILDEMKVTLMRLGYQNFLINAGGDVVAKGAWLVRIRKAGKQSDKILCRVTIKDQAVMSSGNYERGAHLYNPKNHAPVIHNFYGTTVISSLASKAGPLAVALFVMPESIRNRFIDSNPSLKIILQTSEKVVTNALKETLCHREKS